MHTLTSLQRILSILIDERCFHDSTWISQACLVYVTIDRSSGGAAQSEAALEMETRARAGKLADCSTCISVHRSPNDPVSTAGHGWSARNIPTLVNIHDVIKFIFFSFFSSNRERTLVKWDVKMRICCFDSTQYVTYYFRRVFQYFSFLFNRCTRRYITCKILDTSKKWLNTKNIYI